MHFFARRPPTAAPSSHAIDPADCPDSLGQIGTLWEPPILNEQTRLDILERALGPNASTAIGSAYNVEITRINSGSIAGEGLPLYKINPKNDGPAFEILSNGRVGQIASFDGKSIIQLPDPEAEIFSAYHTWVDCILDAIDAEKK